MINRGHELLPKMLLDQLPGLGTQDGKGDQAVVYAKFFTPDSDWVWLLLEYDPESRQAFGLVSGMEVELGYFSMDELEEARGPLGLPIERDLYWTPKTLVEAKKELR